jgi:hypothetical protein
MSNEDIRLEAQAGKVAMRMITTVVDGPSGKEYSLPEREENAAAIVNPSELEVLYSDIPFGLPTDSISPNRPSPNTRGASGLPRYGIDEWVKIFTDRQKIAVGEFVLATTNLHRKL